MKKQTVVPFIDLFEQKYSVSLNATIKFFDDHNFKQLKERTELILFGDMNNVRHLAHTLVDLFEFHTDFIGYYEGMYKYRKVPHYEDAIVLYTIIITTFAAIGTWVSPIIGEEYKEFKKRREKEKKSINLNLILDEFEYFIKAYAIRQAYYFGLISESEFYELKNYILDCLVLKSNGGNSVYDNKVDSIWAEFNKEYKLPLKEALINELNEISKVIDNQPEKIVNTRFVPESSYIFKGLGVSAGRSFGILKVVRGFDDLTKVKRGDIVYFNLHYTPDCVPAIKKSIAAIGSPNCGGMTGHLAIVTRELKIPCVTLVDLDELSDGQVVFIDGSKGEIRILTNKKEIIEALKRS